ncbi:hypothetical protein ACFFK0_04770 [Paenibacillus chartarius]|uniref:Uncharacterized protein n=1 Tax=Paenibacillus chartarius TaxID=747481 RepID=A0ABV6DGK1_9BACL
MAASILGIELLNGSSGVLSALDDGSQNKALRYLVPAHSGKRIELNIRTGESGSILCDVYQQWDEEEIGHLVFVPVQSKVRPAEDAMLLREQPQSSGRAISDAGAAVGGAAVSGAAVSSAAVSGAAGAGASVPFAGGAAEARRPLENALELLEMLLPDLVELNRAEYGMVIMDEIRAALSALKGRN